MEEAPRKGWGALVLLWGAQSQGGLGVEADEAPGSLSNSTQPSRARAVWTLSSRAKREIGFEFAVGHLSSQEL